MWFRRRLLCAAAASASLALSLGLAGPASAHRISMVKAEKAAEAPVYEATLSMDEQYGGAQEYAVFDCRRRGDHRVVCDFAINGSNPAYAGLLTGENGDWSCVGRVRVALRKRTVSAKIASMRYQMHKAG